MEPLLKRKYSCTIFPLQVDSGNGVLFFILCYSKEPIQGFLDDYAFLIKGLLDLYEASLDLYWLNWARELQYKQNELFWDNTNGGYFTCSTDDDTVVLRLKEGNYHSSIFALTLPFYS